MAEIIRQGDPTSHGGTVIEGSLEDICMSKQIASVTHKVKFPKCKISMCPSTLDRPTFTACIA